MRPPSSSAMARSSLQQSAGRRNQNRNMTDARSIQSQLRVPSGIPTRGHLRVPNVDRQVFDSPIASEDSPIASEDSPIASEYEDDEHSGDDVSGSQLPRDERLSQSPSLGQSPSPRSGQGSVRASSCYKFKKFFIQREGKKGYCPSKDATAAMTQVITTFLANSEKFYSSWSKIPIHTRHDMFKLWKNHVEWEPQHEQYMFRAFNHKAGARLSNMCSISRKKKKPQKWMTDEFWDSLNAHWASASFTKISESNKKNRASDKGRHLHTGGCISKGTHGLRLAARLKRNPTEIELYKETHLKSDGSWVHSLSERFAADYQNILTDLKQQHSHVADEANPVSEESLRLEAFKMAGGGMKKGRVYGMGLIDDEFDNLMDLDGSSGPWSQKIDEMEDRIQGRMESLDNEIRAKGGLKDQLAEIKSMLQLSLSLNGLSVQPPPYVPASIAQTVGGAFDNGGGPFPGFGFTQFSHASQQQGLRASHINDVSFTQMLLHPSTSVLPTAQLNQGHARGSGRTRDVSHSG